jgi:hypothetical protein
MIPIEIPRLISDDLWNAAQRKPREKTHGRTYIVSGSCYCSCGACVHGVTRRNKSGGIRQYYSCGGDNVVGKTRCLGYYRADYVQYHVWEYVKSLINSPDMLDDVFDALTNGEYSAIDNRIGVVKSEIEEREKELNELVTMRLTANLESVKRILDQQIEQKGQIIEELKGKEQELQKRLDDRAAIIQYRETLDNFILSIKDEIVDIEQNNDISFMKRIVQMFRMTFIFRRDGDDKYIDVYINGLYTVSRRVSSDDISRKTSDCTSRASSGSPSR